MSMLIAEMAGDGAELERLARLAEAGVLPAAAADIAAVTAVAVRWLAAKALLASDVVRCGALPPARWRGW